jgi:uncharacterized protein (DUF2344 family)
LDCGGGRGLDMAGLKESETLKQLQSRHTKVEAEIKTLTQEARDINNRLNNRKQILLNIENQMNTINIEPTVSEHAVLRYLERYEGICVEDIKNHILSDTLKALITKLGSGKYPLGDGHSVVVKNKCIVSVI